MDFRGTSRVWDSIASVVTEPKTASPADATETLLESLSQSASPKAQERLLLSFHPAPGPPLPPQGPPPPGPSPPGTQSSGDAPVAGPSSVFDGAVIGRSWSDGWSDGSSWSFDASCTPPAKRIKTSEPSMEIATPSKPSMEIATPTNSVNPELLGPGVEGDPSVSAAGAKWTAEEDSLLAEYVWQKMSRKDIVGLLLGRSARGVEARIALHRKDPIPHSNSASRLKACFGLNKTAVRLRRWSRHSGAYGSTCMI